MLARRLQQLLAQRLQQLLAQRLQQLLARRLRQLLAQPLHQLLVRALQQLPGQRRRQEFRQPRGHLLRRRRARRTLICNWRFEFQKRSQYLIGAMHARGETNALAYRTLRLRREHHRDARGERRFQGAMRFFWPFRLVA